LFLLLSYLLVVPMSSVNKCSASATSSSPSSPSSSSHSLKEGRRRIRNECHTRLMIIEAELLHHVSFDRKGYGWCHTSTRKPSKKNGYVQLTFGSLLNGYTPRPYMAHQIVWMHHSGEEPPNPRKDGLNLSHLCCNSLCLRTDHIYREETGINNRRKGCVVYIDCVEEKCEHHGIIYVCNHEPRCIRYHPDFSDHHEMERAFPEGSSHFRPYVTDLKDKDTDDLQLRHSRSSLRQAHLNAILLQHKAAGQFTIKRQLRSIDGPDSSGDEEVARMKSKRRLDDSINAEDDDDDDDFCTTRELEQERKFRQDRLKENLNPNSLLRR